MEVATTGEMGERLIAPKFDGATWSYELVSQVRMGDRVLHWESGDEGRGLMGWSVATSNPEVVTGYTWQPRGTAGRSLFGPRTTDAWMVALGGLNRFARPLLFDDLQRVMRGVLQIGAELEKTNGKPLYFPFYLYGGRQLRAQQGYLLKFPVELFGVFSGLGAAQTDLPAASDRDLVAEVQDRKQAVARGALARVQDPELRSAIENHAVSRAVELYRAAGASDIVKLGKPYDVRLVLDGEERHVEVKGSSLLIQAVELTINEVSHAEDFQHTDLIVVDKIEYTRKSDSIETSGGRVRIWHDWTPSAQDLSPTKFAYMLPPE